jgi:hypothetical protein
MLEQIKSEIERNPFAMIAAEDKKIFARGYCTADALHNVLGGDFNESVKLKVFKFEANEHFKKESFGVLKGNKEKNLISFGLINSFQHMRFLAHLLFFFTLTCECLQRIDIPP